MREEVIRVAGPSESVTIRDEVLPRLRQAGWAEATWHAEYAIANEKVSVVDGRVTRGKPLRADIALIRDEHPIAVVECKRSLRNERDGVQQALDYADRLDVPLAYATNGGWIIEIDRKKHTEHEVARFRTPAEAWAFFRGAKELESDLAVDFFRTPYSRSVVDAHGEPKLPRYYQHVAAQRLLSRIASGDRRLLVVLATGTGKTALAAQLVHVLWQNHWPRGHEHPEDRPRVLYLADRDILVDQPQSAWFRPIFGDDATTRIQGEASTAKNVYFALYQALDQSGPEREELFRRYHPDFFDLVIVDECHRGSAAPSSTWRDVLEHFAPAVQLGMTATPVRRGEVDTYRYFGAPVYQYSLSDGIEDGFLAPFQVIRAHLDRDLEGVQIGEGVRDRAGELVPAGEYGVRQFERSLVLPERTREVARYLTHYLWRTDETAKTIVFCVDQEHAARMREELVNQNSDLLARYGEHWVVRITSDVDEPYRHLDEFCDPESTVPVVAVTSKLLSTGVDVPTARNVVLFRRVESLVEFKQIIGRGTRLAPDYGKEYFTIIDFTGASQRFADPDFDGPPVRVADADAASDDPDVPEAPEVVDAEPAGATIAEPEGEYSREEGGQFEDDAGAITDPDEIEDVTRRSRKHVLDGFDVHVTAEQLYVVDTGDGSLRRVRIQEWVHDRVLTMRREPGTLLDEWATVRGRAELRGLLSETLCFEVDDLAERLRRPDCDPVDLLVWLGWDWPLQTRSQRVRDFRRQERAYLDSLSPDARHVVGMLLEKYEAYGPGDLHPSALQTPPISDLGSVTEIADAFGGAARMHEAIDELGRRLYAPGRAA